MYDISPAKARSLPVRTIAPTSGSCSNASTAEQMSSIVALLSAFSTYVSHVQGVCMAGKGWARLPATEKQQHTCPDTCVGTYAVQGKRGAGRGGQLSARSPNVCARAQTHGWKDGKKSTVRRECGTSIRRVPSPRPTAAPRRKRLRTVQAGRPWPPKQSSQVDVEKGLVSPPLAGNVTPIISCATQVWNA